MKNLLKIGTLSLVLLSAVFMLNTNAADVPGQVTLDITTINGTCTYGTSLYIGTHEAQYDAHNMTGEFFGGLGAETIFECKDTEGLSSFVMTMEATEDLTNATSQSIPKENVFMIANTNTVTAGMCTIGANQDTWATIGSSPKTILNKASAVGQICTITSTGVNLAVEIPASQPVGTYTGTLSLVMPF